MNHGVEPITTDCPRPVRRPVMLQGWYDLASVHWPYDPAEIQRLLPAGLRVDTCGGTAWVGLIPFHMRRIRIPGCPPFGRWSTFPETNVRTYVVAPDGRRAVWFFSLDISRLVPATVARLTYGLPLLLGDHVDLTPWSRRHRIHGVEASTAPAGDESTGDPDRRSGGRRGSHRGRTLRHGALGTRLAVCRTERLGAGRPSSLAAPTGDARSL